MPAKPPNAALRSREGECPAPCMTQTRHPALRWLHLTGKPLTGGRLQVSPGCKERSPRQDAWPSGDSVTGQLTKPCGWQGLGAPARCQTCASEVGQPSSGHWSTRDLPAPRNNKWQKLSQRFPSQSYDPAPLNDQQAPVLNTPCQKPGRQKHNPTH